METLVKLTNREVEELLKVLREKLDDLEAVAKMDPMAVVNLANVQHKLSVEKEWAMRNL